MLKNELGYTHISTGDRCRKEKESKSVIGLTMCEYESKGELVPDEIMKNLFSEIIEESRNEKGIILDGFPRTRAQVDDLLMLISEKGLRIKKVINIDVPRDELLRRAESRALTSLREDDKNKDTHIKRIRIFEEETKPAISYMATKLTIETFNGLGSIEEITEKIKNYIMLQ